MKDEILIRYINKHCTATEEKEILEWLKEKDNRQRLFELEQIWGLKAEMRFSDKGRMDEAYRQLSRQLGLSGQIEKREKPIQRFTVREWWKYAAVLVAVCLFATNLFYITKEEPEAYNTVVIPKGQRVSLLLRAVFLIRLSSRKNIERSHWKERAILRWHIIPNVRLR